MLKTFFKTAYRNLSRNKLFTILNVIGLSVGMSVSLLFVSFLSLLFRYDNFHTNQERIYRVTTKVKDNNNNPWYASAPSELRQKLEDDIPGVEKVTRIQQSLYGDVVYKEKEIELDGYFADPEFFEIFNFPLIQGNEETMLSNPNSIVLTETEAKKIFGDKDAMGETISMEPYGDFQVTGIVEDLPENSHLDFGAVASYATLLSPSGELLLVDQEVWISFRNSYVYFRTQNDADPDAIEQSLNVIAKQHYTEKDFQVSFDLQRLDEIVPGPEMENTLGSSWSYLGISIIGLMVLIILIPACSNYVHLSIAQSLERMKEIGVRKVMGGQKKHIILQFIVESTTIVFIALFFSYIFFEVLREDFLTQVLGTSMDLSATPMTYAGFIFFALLVGIVAGIFPAIYFSRIGTVYALKGKELKKKSRFTFKMVVLTSQFMLSLGFIMAVVIMMRQYDYSVNYDFGFEQEDLLDVELQGVDPQIFTHEFGKINSVQEISMSSHLLGIAPAPKKFIKTFDLTDSIQAASISINESFISNFELELMSGRDFGENENENSRIIIVNEEFMKNLYAKDSLGAMGQSFILEDGRVVRIGGVVKNFNYTNLRTPIQNFFFEYNPEKFAYANLKLDSDDIAGDLALMETTWKNIRWEREFTAELFSNEIQDAYSFYKEIIKLWGFLGFMAITVACLGLLGTVSFNIQKRYKEISIRKVLGSSTNRLVLLLSKDFFLIMLVASVITIPVMYYLFNFLLGSIQHYNVQIGLVEILLSLAIILILGLLTILSQTFKAASANPVNNLRSE